MTLPLTIPIAKNSKHPLTVNRLGYGTMRLTGEGVYGEPTNRPEALEILKSAIRSGVNFLDTADYYGEDVTNRLIVEALYPYPKDLIICTKVGATRKPDKSWLPFLTPENIATAIDKNLSTLKLEQISLVHLRVMPGARVPFKESLEAMFELQKIGKILHVGVSNVTAAELETALSMGEIASVENMFGHGGRTTMKSPYGENRGGEEVLGICEKNEIPLIPYWSLVNSLPKKEDRIKELADRLGATEAQVNIAWLLHRSPWILPIPGTTQLKHFEENMGSVEIKLSERDMEYLG
jgi:pyridoxine 4-dehydrogenase